MDGWEQSLLKRGILADNWFVITGRNGQCIGAPALNPASANAECGMSVFCIIS